MVGPSVRLFISCVSDEFGSYRDVLRKALTGPNVEVKIQKDFKGLGGDTLNMLEDYIEQCEAVVHFIGDMAGSAPPATSVEDLLARRAGLQDKLARKGLTPAALAALTYTQWEAWLAIGFDKDLLIVAPAPGVERGPSYVPLDASRESQAAHQQRLKAIDRHPIEFTNADNLVAKIVNSAVIDALVRARAPSGYAKTRELLGAMIAATIAVVSLLAMFIALMLPEEIPIFLRVLGAGTVGLFLLVGAYYWYILVRANEPEGSLERSDYDALLEQLESGGTPAKAYRHWLTEALDRVDVFFGDPGRNDKSRFARMLGLETPGARWTAPAFDRCLWLALLYPIVTIIAVWAWSGHVCVAERALGLEDSLAGLGRSAYVLTLAIALYATWRFFKTQRTLWVVVFFGAASVFTTVAGVNATSAVAKVVLFAIVVPFAPGARNPGVICFLGIVAVAFYSVPVDPISSSASIVASVGVIIFVSRLIDGTGRQGAFLALFFPAAMVVVFAGVCFFPSSKSWSIAGPILLIFGLLTLVNAPFEWFAIGLTRALLRRGLAPGGRGPFFYAVVDALTAVPVIAILSFVTVFTVQTFEDIAALRGGPDARIMPLDTLFAGLDLHPGDPEYWWLWLMLFSTLIPSALNLCAAAASLIRGLPFLNTWIVKRMQTAGSMRDSDRLMLASALSAQIAGGFLATGVALYLIGVWLLPRWLPFLGGHVRDFSEALAAYNAPARIMMWFAGAH